MEKIAALVVTRNRLECLKRCVAALEAQTHPLTAIVVIDNDSNDGTAAWCKANSKITHLQQSNLGSAGGLHTGLEWVLQNGYDRAWLMDDDGYPECSSLEKLLAAATADYNDWLNSLVLCIDDHSRLAWGLTIGGKHNANATEVQAAGKYIEDANPFNGTLIRRQVIEKIGNIAAELFIKGDESEYHRRAIRHRIKVVTVTDSLFYHPEIFSENVLTSPFRAMWRFYFTVRNQDAVVSADGRVKLSTRGAWTYAKPVIRQLVHRICQDVLRIFILLHGVIAAWVNDLKRRYVK